VLRSTATLACVGRRQRYFRDEFLSALEILHRGDLRPEQMKGSWAGAFGPTQFMPTAFKRFAVDFDGDGRRDVVDSVADLIASTANNLKKDGWVAGTTWGYEVILPKGFNYLLADRSRRLTLREWQMHGIRRAELPSPQRPRLSAGSDRQPRARLPNAAQFPSDHEIQSSRSLCTGNRSPRRPTPWRQTVHAAMAAAGTGSIAR
jgi:membrane-bound lytic murein transglycosylase B